MKKDVKITYTIPIVVTKEQFDIAYNFLCDDPESLLELLTMKLASDVYLSLCNYRG